MGQNARRFHACRDAGFLNLCPSCSMISMHWNELAGEPGNSTNGYKPLILHFIRSPEARRRSISVPWFRASPTVRCQSLAVFSSRLKSGLRSCGPASFFSSRTSCRLHLPPVFYRVLDSAAAGGGEAVEADQAGGDESRVVLMKRFLVVAGDACKFSECDFGDGADIVFASR